VNAKHKVKISGHDAPDSNEEYFLYQTLLGVWPLEQEDSANLLERVQAHLIKATREAMVHTRWTRPNQPHEDALQNFASRVLSVDNLDFLHDFREFHSRIAYFGMINGLSQALLKIAAPGVADFYQGSELWDLRLVDPDNRGPIDFAKRSTALKGIASSESAAPDRALRDLVTHWQDGRIKLYLIWKALSFRRAHADLFLDAEFVPLESAGCRAANIIAFLRRTANSSALIAVPRWLSQLPTPANSSQPSRAEDLVNREFDWCDTRVILPAGSPSVWESILTPGRLSTETRDGQLCLLMSEVFRDFPVAFLSGNL